MKIMHIGQMIGGLDVYIRNSIEAASGNNEYIIVHGKEDECKPIQKPNKKVKMYPTDLQRSLSFFKDSKTLLEVIKLVKKEKPDLIHCHSAKGGMIGRIVGHITQTPTFYTAHAFSFLSTSHKWLSNIYIILEKITRFKTYLLACSESEQEMGRNIIGYDDEHALVWHNAVPEKTIDETVLKVQIPDHPYLCYIGRPSYQKNPLFLVHVFDKLHKIQPNIHFYLLGVGFHSPELEIMNKEIKNCNLEKHFHTIPWVDQNDALNFVKHAILYMTVSLYEGLPLSVIEAMELGKCIVASDVVGNRDCVRNDKNGYVLPLEVNVFCNALNELLNNPEKIDHFGKESRRIFEQDFKIENRIHLLEEIYKQQITIHS